MKTRESVTMQEFLTNNTVNCNLMSLTGYRTLVIFEALLQSPKSNSEINDYLFNNQYVKERFSSDTLRIYINSLRAIGCEITRANQSNDKKYVLLSHPFDYDIQKQQLKALTKLYKSIYDKIDVREAITLENFFKKLAAHLKNEVTKNALKNISVLKRINPEILDDLLIHCKNKNQIVFLYNSPRSGAKEIEIVADKLEFKSEKLYIWGNNVERKEYSYFAVERILNICNIKLKKDSSEIKSTKIIYELTNNNSYKCEENEKIIKKDGNKLIIEFESKNEFSAIQKILHFANDCKIISPDSFRLNFLEKLKSMEKIYENI